MREEDLMECDKGIFITNNIFSNLIIMKIVKVFSLFNHAMIF